MNYVYNNQLDALFILSLLNYRTSACFGLSTAHHQEVWCVYVAIGTLHCTIHLLVTNLVLYEVRTEFFYRMYINIILMGFR
jgi:hypothetical protein